MSNSVQSPDQLTLPFAAEIVPSRTPALASVDWDRRLTLARLVCIVSNDLQLPEGYADPADVSHAQVPALEHGLYIPTNDRRYRNAEQLVTLAASEEVTDRRVPAANVGIVFPATEFKTVARNPRDLAKHVKTTTRAANESLFDRDEVDRKVMHSAGLALESKVKAMNRLQNTFIDERQLLRSLHIDLKSRWRAHYKGRNLDKKRVDVDEKIHATAELASINLNLDTTAVNGLHRAIKQRLYGNLPQDTLVRNWREHIIMVGRHTNAKIDRVIRVIGACQNELEIYAPFMQRGE